VCQLFFLFFSLLIFSQWLLHAFILLGNNSLQLLGLPSLLIFLKTCLKLTMVRTSQQQLPLRSSFAPMMRNQLSGFSHRGTVCRGGNQVAKTQVRQCFGHLPKQVLRDILDTVDVCNESDQPFDLLKDILLGQFGKSKWQSYFELLRLPMGKKIQGLQAQNFHGKTQTTSSPWHQPRQRSFPLHVFGPRTAFHAVGRRCRKPQDSRGDG
jgi:hypothetical protein